MKSPEYYTWLLLATKPILLVKALVACVICGAYALIQMNVFGDNEPLSTLESLILLIGSIVAAHFIVNLFTKRKK